MPLGLGDSRRASPRESAVARSTPRATATRSPPPRTSESFGTPASRRAAPRATLRPPTRPSGEFYLAYRTRTRASPWAGAVGAASRRSRPRRTPASHPGVARARSDGHHAAHDVAHHVVQVAIRGDDEADPTAPPHHVQRAHGTDGIDPPARRRAERAEVVSPPEGAQRAAHGPHVERARHVPGEPAQERAGHEVAVDQVRVALARGLAPRVEARSGLDDLAHADVGRDDGVERAPDRLRGERRRRVERRHLAQGVDARVGSARSGQTRGGIEAPGRLDQGPLDGRALRLDLPARVGAAVVGHDEAERAGRALRG